MKHFKEIEIPAQPSRVQRIETDTSCDFCKEIIRERLYDINEVTIEHREGNGYPSSGYAETTSVDMCGKYFKEKLIPWVKSQGIEMQVKEYDW